MTARCVADVPVGTVATLDEPAVDPLRRRRLAELGLRCGAEVHILARTAGGGRVIALADDRVVVDLGTARALVVRVPADQDRVVS